MAASADISAMREMAKELDQLTQQLDGCYLEIKKLDEKISSCPEMTEKSVDVVLKKIRSLCVHAAKLSEREVSLRNAMVSILDGMDESGPSVATSRKNNEVNKEKKRKRMNIKKKEKRIINMDTSRYTATPLMRTLLDCINLKGEQVAARVTDDNAEKDEWFVVRVTHFDSDAKEFHVLDEEPGDDEEGMPMTYKLPISRIIPLPKMSDPSSAPELSQGQQVLAVYPGTTALYKATVVDSHRERKSDDYLLEFDDDEEDGSLPQRSVPFYEVVALPEGHRQ